MARASFTCRVTLGLYRSFVKHIAKCAKLILSPTITQNSRQMLVLLREETVRCRVFSGLSGAGQSQEGESGI